MINFIIGAIVFGFLGFTVFRLIKNTKQGKSACGHDCSSCPFACDGSVHRK